ncbi:MAG: hypothetical protein IJT28_09805 [Bacteroidaceae bacterium]|nr:hypothetical protein [Bacteroidaceae bacterium]
MRQLLYILLLFCTASASAYDFEVDGIYYNILESELWEHENPTVEVTYGQIGGRGKEATPTYVGDMEIPACVMWEGTEYQVIGIGYSAFFSPMCRQSRCLKDWCLSTMLPSIIRD